MLIGTAGLAYGCGGSTTTRPSSSHLPATTTPSAVVQVRNVRFSPERIVVRVGQIVRWHFDDNPLPHGVLADSPDDEPGLDSGLRYGGTYDHRFLRPGTVRYHCLVHDMMMVGEVEVVR